MFSKFGLGAAVLLISAMPALAQSTSCVNPIAPAAIDGAKATEQQMKDAHDDVVNFIKSSDDYQQCIINDLAAQKREAAKAKDAKPLDPAIEQAASAKIDGNQRMKEKVGAEYNAAVQGYKGAHPKG